MHSEYGRDRPHFVYRVHDTYVPFYRDNFINTTILSMKIH